ncbi:di-trans,poly-cis-decaprenylcistransferase [Ruminococcaceae bacterium OttesenSCG-928-O06]|nr:di-trans,poly-cis-decaprenylcistransferase [Ruminococcaceae bacterium OttesenSCG-928-O06]
MEQNHSAEGLSIGIIMDGNGRWAKQRGLPRTAGHKKGADVFDDITRYANEQGVRAITYYAFSTENWSRPADELEVIMDLFGQSLKRLYKYRKENNRVVFLGERTALLPAHQKMMDEIESETQSRTGMILNIAINYGGQQEITKAARELAQLAAEGKLNPADINEDMLEGHLYTKGQPMPDFILRTSGEMRISNFLLWQCAYSELLFTDLYWPDFRRKHFDEAVQEFHSRNRRFGGIGE